MNASRALDVNGQSDANGANVQIWSVNYTSGQYVTVTGSGTSQVLRFPLTGRVLDVCNAQAANGANVIQWPGNNGKNQSWNIVKDPQDRKMTIGGKTYDTYVIYSNLGNNLVLDVYGQQTAAGTNVIVWAANGGDNQRWAFIPVRLLPAGNYRFVSAADQRSCVTAANGNDGGNVQTAGINYEDNKQVWTVTNGDSNCNIRNYASKCYMSGTNSNSGATVVQKAKINGDRTSWLLKVEGSMKFNGATYPLVRVQLQLGTDQCLDAAGGGTKLITDVRTYSYNGQSGQRFIAVPAAPIDTSIPAPSGLGMAWSKGGSIFTNPWGRNAVNAYPCWISGYSEFQFRYRQRVRKATSGDESFGGWSPWQFYVGNTANDGWGDVTKANMKPTLARDPSGTNRRYGIGHQYTISTTGNDCIEYEYQVRAFSKGLRGNVATLRGRYKYQPTFTLEGFTWLPEGLRFLYHSDQKRNNNDLVVYSITCAHGGRTYTMFDGGASGYPLNDIPWNGSITMPQSKLKYIPSKDDRITAVVTFSNVDGAYKQHKQTVSALCSLDSGKGDLKLAPDVNVTAGKMLYVNANVSGATRYSLWVDYWDNKTGFIRYDDSNGVWNVPLLFNRPYRVYLLVEKGDKWDVFSVEKPAVPDPDSYLFNFVNASGAQDYLQIMVDADQPPRFTRSISYDSDVRMTNGNSLEVVHFGTARKEELSSSGAFPLTFNIQNSNVAKVEALVNAHYAWLRLPKVTEELAWRVAVESCDLDYSEPKFIRVSLNLRRINNPADW